MRILYLSPWSYYKKKIARHRFQTMEAISRLAEVMWSGPGWDNYRSGLTVSQNIYRLYRGACPDLVIAFPTPHPIKGLPELRLKKCFRYDEMHTPDGDPAPLDEIPRNKIDWVVCHYENEMNHPVFKSLGVAKSHLPMCADSNIFRDYGLEKKTDVLLVGSINEGLYPLRHRLFRVLDRIASTTSLICRVYQKPHGIDFSSNQHQVEFAMAINASKIALTCSSKYRYALAKYVEIPMSGTVLMGDLPDERKEAFSNFMLAIDAADSDEIIEAKIVRCANDAVERAVLISRGLIFASALTTDDYARRFMELADQFICNNQVGAAT